MQKDFQLIKIKDNKIEVINSVAFLNSSPGIIIRKGRGLAVFRLQINQIILLF